MPHEGQELAGPNGFGVKFLRITDEVLEMEAAYSGEGGLPPSHFHPHQDERFVVLDGAMKAFVGGDEARYVAGQSFEVPAGTPHQMTADGPARVLWQVRPALRTAEFFECVYGGSPRPDLLEKFADEFRFSS